MSTTSTPTGGIKEYFLLADARATAKRIPEDARTGLARKLGIGRQRAEAADALWSNGHTAEGLRLAAEAFEATLEAVPEFAEATGMEVARDAQVEPLTPEARAPEAKDDAAEAEATEAAVEAGAEEKAEREAAEADADAEVGEAEEKAAEAEEEAAEADAAAEAAADEDADEAVQAAAERKAAEADAAAEAAADEAAEPAPEPVEDRAPAPRASRPSMSGTHAWMAVLRARGLSKGKLDDVIEADNALRATDLPSLDDEVTAAHGELFQRLVGTRRHVERAIAPAAMTPGQINWTQFSRIGFAALLIAAVATGLYFLVRTPEGIEARASARHGPDFPPEKVIDDDPATEWLLPDRSAGWIEVSISPPTHVGTLRLLNSHNRQYNDRATREYSVELYVDGEPARTIEGSWDEFQNRPEWTEHEVGLDEVERIRFNAESWHRTGAGLAEIDWE